MFVFSHKTSFVYILQFPSVFRVCVFGATTVSERVNYEVSEVSCVSLCVYCSTLQVYCSVWSYLIAPGG